MKIYFAGKILTENNWRKDFLKLGIHFNKDADLELKDYPGVYYAGPFFDTWHGQIEDGPHGMNPPYHPHDILGLRGEIFCEDVRLIGEADAIFAWISTDGDEDYHRSLYQGLINEDNLHDEIEKSHRNQSISAYGTICEIGIAYGMGIPVHLATSLNLSDLWFVEQACKTCRVAPLPSLAFRELYETEWRPQEYRRPAKGRPAGRPSFLPTHLQAAEGSDDLAGYQPCVTCGDMTRRYRIEINGECRPCFVSHDWDE